MSQQNEQQPERFCVHDEAKAKLVMVLCNLCEQERTRNGGFRNTDWYIDPRPYKTAAEAKEKADDFARRMKFKRVEDCKHCK